MVNITRNVSYLGFLLFVVFMTMALLAYGRADSISLTIEKISCSFIGFEIVASWIFIVFDILEKLITLAIKGIKKHD